MAKDPAFLFMYKDWITTTAGWDSDVRGWYVNLLAHQADKPEGLSTDLEYLASLAGVKISEYSRFCTCWHNLLATKFEINPAGLLQEAGQAAHLAKRRKYKNEQERWGMVGNFIRIVKQNHSLCENQYKELSKFLFKAIIHLVDKEEIEKNLQKVFDNYIADKSIVEELSKQQQVADPIGYPKAYPKRIIANANESKNELERKNGVAENKPQPQPLGMDIVKQMATKAWQDEKWKQSINYGHGLDKDSNQLKRWMSLFNASLCNDPMPNFNEELYKKLFGGWLSMQKSKGRKLANIEVDVGEKPLERLQL